SVISLCGGLSDFSLALAINSSGWSYCLVRERAMGSASAEETSPSATISFRMSSRRSRRSGCFAGFAPGGDAPAGGGDWTLVAGVAMELSYTVAALAPLRGRRSSTAGCATRCETETADVNKHGRANHRPRRRHHDARRRCDRQRRQYVAAW